MRLLVAPEPVLLRQATWDPCVNPKGSATGTTDKAAAPLPSPRMRYADPLNRDSG